MRPFYPNYLNLIDNSGSTAKINDSIGSKKHKDPRKSPSCQKNAKANREKEDYCRAVGAVVVFHGRWRGEERSWGALEIEYDS